ncbi:hypothetical protein C900_05520 [Fulvivirga imtechensis AK7]|uniref:Uncharacterized protein n=1 Tax=Fulvivirga imtechensis AK7 TaxID=1237149 RepID=L8JJQ4_9BACT|nr:hypothetical protein C900_05520 [Fulvivirga imtechensis AK7]
MVYWNNASCHWPLVAGCLVTILNEIAVLNFGQNIGSTMETKRLETSNK